ncbi:MAG: hypothetical protein FJ145_13325 [Deltaproteobacteria bacterium]|nr:hypothetical protein [Deltaproteobacteria bacterium]
MSRSFSCAVLMLALVSWLQSCQPTPTAPPAPSEPPAPTLPPAPSPEPATPPEPTPATVELKVAPRVERSLPESQLAAPQRDVVSLALKYDSRLLRRTLNQSTHPGWQYRINQQNQIVGFDFSNRGGNRILPQRYDSSRNQFFGRDFQFRFDERARQDIHLLIADWAPARDGQFRLSELMNSIFLFFPRMHLPAIVNTMDRTLVSLPTGEEVEFNARTNEVVHGVLTEEPVDLNPDRNLRRFPAVRYTGKGLMVRADARGSDPRLNGTAAIQNRGPNDLCRVPTPELWHNSGAVRFKFATDEEFDRFLLSRCNFGLGELKIKK